MARGKARGPLQVRQFIEYKGRVLPIEAFTPEDADRAIAIATLPMARVMNPGWDVQLTEEAKKIDLEAYFKDAPTVGSLYKTEAARKFIDEEYARGAM